jgi:diacylglycerol kinase (ATP)
VTKLAVVVNPRAGKGRATRVWERFRAVHRELDDAHVVSAASPIEARDSLRRLDFATIERVLVFGGDGSFQLVGNVLLELGVGRQVALAPIPGGTGSDLARGLGIGAVSDAVLERAISAPPRPIDVFRVETDADADHTRFALNVFSVGISGEVNRAVNERQSRGTAAYLEATLIAVWRYRPRPLRVFLDGNLWHEGEALVVTVANGPVFGQGMHIAPGARFDDGEADIVWVDPVPPWQLPFRLPQLYRGTHLKTRFVRTAKARTVRVEPLAPIPPLDADGEPVPGHSATITVEAHALQIVC